MEKYASIIITVKAPSDQIEQNELALSDKVSFLQDDVEEFINAKDTPFKFEIYTV